MASTLFGTHGHLRIEAWTDADFAGSRTDRRSTTGYLTTVGGTWRSKKQSVVSPSSAEAEYHAMSHGLCELLWLQTLLTDLRIPVVTPMPLYCYNTSAIRIAANPVLPAPKEVTVRSKRGQAWGMNRIKSP